MTKLADIPESECSCSKCQAMCHQPCWPAPEEARRLVDAGFADRLRADYWVGGGGPNGDDDILVLCPALAERHGDVKPAWPREEGLSCTFFVGGLCQLHDRGLKPLEGRLAHHDKSNPSAHEAIKDLWNNPDAQALANEWIAKHGHKHEPQDSMGQLMGVFRDFAEAFEE